MSQKNDTFPLLKCIKRYVQNLPLTFIFVHYADVAFL